MKKLGCASCGGTKKMAKGGTTKSVSISKRGAGVVKETKGDTNQKMGIYGIAQTGPTGPNNSGIATMKKGGMVKKPLMKAQSGGRIVNSPDGKSQGIIPGNDNYKSYSAVGTKKSPTPYQDYMKRPGADASDTLVKSGSTWAGYNAKNPKNNKALIKAVKATDKVSPMKKGGVVKSSMKKMQVGGKTTGTPFQKGVANKDFKASDTNYVSKYLLLLT